MRRLLALIVMTALVAVACGSDRDSGGDEALPFDAVLLELFGTDDVDAYRYRIERQAEANLVQCMADAGFQFVVDAPEPPEVVDDPYVERAVVEAQGFGIVTRFRDWMADADIDAIRRDLNREYLLTLTGDQMQQYFLTLEGEVADPGQISENPGCRGTAADEAYAVWNRFLADLPNFTAMGEERDTHPDWLAARADWRDCMTDAGYDYSEPEVIRTDVENLMTERVAAEFPEEGLPIVRDADGWVVDPAADALLDELLQLEIEVALANFECNQPLLDRFKSVEREVQQGFVDRNQVTIDQLLADLS